MRDEHDDTKALLKLVERIAVALEKFVNEGITIYTHQGSDADQN